MKLDLLTNATVVDDAIRFVSQSEKSKDKDIEHVKSSSSSDSSNEDYKEFKEPGYNDDDENSDKAGEEKQEHDTGEITTTNKVF